MKSKPFFLLVSIFLLFNACNDDNIPTPQEQPEDLQEPVKKELFSGFVQKGPFINGSSILISELDTLLNQTGRVYSTSIVDNAGSFEKKEIELVSNFIQLKADGYYFNEVTGKASTGPVTLYALVNIENRNSANVNVLTHLERARVEHLMKEEKKSFFAAKEQALQEILAIFNLKSPESTQSEALDLTENGILLAVSCILQGQVSTANMIELMANISLDIATDGELNNESLGSRLIENAMMISPSDIRKNLENKYAELGMTEVMIPDFGNFIQQFIDNTPYLPERIITYPERGIYGINILHESTVSIVANRSYSMSAALPEGTSLKVIIKGGHWYYTIVPAPVNWTVSIYNESAKIQEFRVTESGKDTDLHFSPDYGTYGNSDSILIEYYENGSTEPTKTKLVKVL